MPALSLGKFHLTIGNVIGAIGVAAGWVTAHAGLLPQQYATDVITIAGLILTVSNSIIKHAPPVVSSTDAQSSATTADK